MKYAGIALLAVVAGCTQDAPVREVPKLEEIRVVIPEPKGCAPIPGPPPYDASKLQLRVYARKLATMYGDCATR